MIITDGKCHRAVYYRITGVPSEREIEPKGRHIFATGFDWEDRCVEATEKAGVLSGKGVRVQDDSLPLRISGEIDAVNWYKDGDETKYYVIDYKSTGGYHNSSSLIGNTKKDPFPKVQNLLQLLVYMKMDPRFEFGMLAYLVRDFQDTTQFQIDLTEEDGITYPVINGVIDRRYSLNEIYRRYAVICDYYERQVLPPRDKTPLYTAELAQAKFDLGLFGKTNLEKVKKGKAVGDSDCTYCDFYETCQQDGA